MTTLFLIESSTKAKFLQKILGSEYLVMATQGNILNFKAGKISIAKGKEEIIKKIREVAKKCDNILIATDSNSEGEILAWSLAYMLNINYPKRIIFNTCTKNDLEIAIKNPQQLNYKIINAFRAKNKF